MFGVYSLYVRWVFDKGSIDFRWMLDGCSIDVRWMFDRCSMICAFFVLYRFRRNARFFFLYFTVFDRIATDVAISIELVANLMRFQFASNSNLMRIQFASNSNLMRVGSTNTDVFVPRAISSHIKSIRCYPRFFPPLSDEWIGFHGFPNDSMHV